MKMKSFPQLMLLFSCACYLLLYCHVKQKNTGGIRTLGANLLKGPDTEARLRPGFSLISTFIHVRRNCGQSRQGCLSQCARVHTLTRLSTPMWRRRVSPRRQIVGGDGLVRNTPNRTWEMEKENVGSCESPLCVGVWVSLVCVRVCILSVTCFVWSKREVLGTAYSFDNGDSVFDYLHTFLWWHHMCTSYQAINNNLIFAMR